MKGSNERHASQIEAVTTFFDVIGDCSEAVSLLLGRNVINPSGDRELVNSWNPKKSASQSCKSNFETSIQDCFGSKALTSEHYCSLQKWDALPKKLEIAVLRNSLNLGVTVNRYSKNEFIENFSKIYPPISLELVLSFIEEIQNSKRQRSIREAKGLEAEAIRQEQLGREEKKQELIKEIKNLFWQDFLIADLFYCNECTKYISHSEYQAEKASYVQLWVQNNLGFKSDSEQATAIGAIEGHVQIVARAGSGKTRTLVSRALFLQKHCGVLPHEMLLLAFNKKAANEICDRLTKQLQGSIPHVMTFHALAYALVHPEGILVNDPDGEQSRSRALQTVIDDYLRDSDYQEKIRGLMTTHFREDWERIIAGGYHQTPQEILKYRRSLPKESLRGEYVKSFGEKIIADFLFEHDINYKYERNFWWDGINYRPDFTIFTGNNQGVVIEYFGLKGDPDYDEMSDEKRKYWDSKNEWKLLEFCPEDLVKDGIEGFYASLKQSLESHQIACKRLSEEEIWLRIKDRAIDRFTAAMENFIQRCRKQALSADDLVGIIARHTCKDAVEERFLELAVIFYQAYLERLQGTGEEDFDGLIQRSAELVSSGQTEFRRTSGNGDLKCLRYILIDEYQDFSKLFYQLIESIREQNPEVQLFCVGDDWQAINGFAGSDLSFYKNFDKLFHPSKQLAITTNYRSATSIVAVSNELMKGFGTYARAHRNASGKVEIVDLRNFKPSPSELRDYPGDDFTPAILRLVGQALKQDKNVVLLSRKNSLPWYINHKNKQNIRQGKLSSFLNLIRSKFSKESHDKISISTTHKYKGLEKDVVIILDAVSRSYPLLHPDLMFTFALGDTIERAIDEERRLFYVALTRAIDHLYIFTEANNYSPFLQDLESRISIPSLDWSAYPPFVGVARCITIRVSNKKGSGSNGTYALRELLRAEGYDWDSRLKHWWKNYPIEGFSVQLFLADTQWVSHANGIQVQFCDDLEKPLATYTIDAGQAECIFDNTNNHAES